MGRNSKYLFRNALISIGTKSQTNPIIVESTFHPFHFIPLTDRKLEQSAAQYGEIKIYSRAIPRR